MSEQNPEKAAGDSKAGLLYTLLGAIVVLAVATLVLALKAQGLSRELSSSQTTALAVRAEFDQAQADLAKAKAGLADLAKEVQAAKTAAADAQGQAERLQSEKAALEATLTREKADHLRKLDQMRTVAATATGDAANLRAEVAVLQQDNARLSADLDKARTSCTELSTRLGKAEGELAGVQPILARARQLPVATTVTRTATGAFSGHPYTLVVSNLQANPLRMQVTIEGADGTRTFSNRMDANGSMRVEKLAAKDKVTLGCEGYDPIVVPVQ
jgi:chromosome segregation ATPase